MFDLDAHHYCVDPAKFKNLLATPEMSRIMNYSTGTEQFNLLNYLADDANDKKIVDNKLHFASYFIKALHDNTKRLGESIKKLRSSKEPMVDTKVFLYLQMQFTLYTGFDIVIDEIKRQLMSYDTTIGKFSHSTTESLYECKLECLLEELRNIGSLITFYCAKLDTKPFSSKDSDDIQFAKLQEWEHLIVILKKAAKTKGKILQQLLATTDEFLKLETVKHGKEPKCLAEFLTSVNSSLTTVNNLKTVLKTSKSKVGQFLNPSNREAENYPKEVKTFASTCHDIKNDFGSLKDLGNKLTYFKTKGALKSKTTKGKQTFFA